MYKNDDEKKQALVCVLEDLMKVEDINSTQTCLDEIKFIVGLDFSLLGTIALDDSILITPRAYAARLFTGIVRFSSPFYQKNGDEIALYNQLKEHKDTMIREAVIWGLKDVQDLHELIHFTHDHSPLARVLAKEAVEEIKTKHTANLITK